MAQHETAVLVISDLHYGKKTSTYNPGVFQTRMDNLGEKLAEIRELLQGYDFDKLVVCCLGDANDGTDIYPTQTHHQRVSNVEQQAWELSDRLVPFLRNQKAVWGDVSFHAVPGNHGRSGKSAHEAANWDLVMYRYLALKAMQYDIPVDFNEAGDPFIHKIGIRGHGYLLYHGHDIYSQNGIPWYGIFKKLSLWGITKRLAPFDVAMMGHFHAYGSWQFNRIHMLSTGTLVSDDDWALRTLGWESANKWHLFGVSNGHPITWRFDLDLAEDLD